MARTDTSKENFEATYKNLKKITEIIIDTVGGRKCCIKNGIIKQDGEELSMWWKDVAIIDYVVTNEEAFDKVRTYEYSKY